MKSKHWFLSKDCILLVNIHLEPWTILIHLLYFLEILIFGEYNYLAYSLIVLIYFIHFECTQIIRTNCSSLPKNRLTSMLVSHVPHSPKLVLDILFVVSIFLFCIWLLMCDVIFKLNHETWEPVPCLKNSS